MSVRPSLLVAGLLVLPLRAALADTLLVPQEFTTIQAAVNAADNDDTILIQSGVYAEAVEVFSVNDLVIRGKGKVILQPPSASPGLTLTLCTGCRVEKLEVRAPATHGILLFDCADVVVSRCRVTGASGNGVHVKNCGNVRIESCTITDSGTDAIALGEELNPATSCLVLHNKLLGAGNDGVSVRGAGNSVIGNVVSGAGQGGLQTIEGSGTSQNIFSGNKISDCGIGVILSGEGDVVSGNVISKTLDDAVLIVGASGHAILGNRMISNGGSGVYTNDGIVGVVVDGNRISKPHAWGLRIGGDGAVVTSNVVKGAGNDGLLLAGDQILCLDNTSTGNAVAGFALSGAGLVLSGNVGKGNAAFDLDDSGVGNTVNMTNVFGTVAP